MITIGIPVLNGSQRISQCLESIFKTIDTNKYNINVLVLDDGSSEEELNKIKSIIHIYNNPKLELLMHSYNMGVSKSWNDLTNHYNNDITVLLNDDIQVTKHWLDVVVYTLQNNPIIGTVGLNAYEGPNRNNGSQIFPTYIESKLLYGSPSSPLLSSRGYAFGFLKENFNQVNGFDERYFCFFEEVDFNLKLLQIGKRNVMLSYPILLHGHGETTTTNLPNPNEIFNISKKLFEEKWNINWSDLRLLFNSNNIQTMPSLINEWNSNLDIWN